jgi:serine/threonine-protein kinase
MQKLGRYELIREVGRGGMATVYLARDPNNPTQALAVKVLPPQLTHDPQFRGRFEREVRALTQLKNPFIVPIYDFGQEGDQPYLVMRYLEGGTLSDRIVDRVVPLAEVLPIAQRIATALDAVHQAGVVHRDLKPGNILFDKTGQAYLTDFGVVKLAEESVAFTQSGMIVGTPKYMSPEQAMGGKIDYRSDLYSFAVILYEMLAGQHPFADSDTPVGMMLKHVSDPVPTLQTARLRLPPRCNAILMRALSKRPEERYASATELVKALTALNAPAPSDVLPVAMAQGKKLNAYACAQCNGLGLEVQDDGRAACRFCGTINAIPGVICAECECVNPTDEVYCSACRQALARFCPTCQAQNWAGADYCVECGEPLDALSYLTDRWGQKASGSVLSINRAEEMRALKAVEEAAAQKRRAALDDQARAYEAKVRASQQRQTEQQQQALLYIGIAALVIIAIGVMVAVVMLSK